MKAMIIWALLATAAQPTHLPTPTPSASSVLERLDSYRVAQRRTCKSVSTCQEAVELWCGGYRRADGDGDGIPCETVCSSKAEVDEIKAQIGC